MDILSDHVKTHRALTYKYHYILKKEFQIPLKTKNDFNIGKGSSLREKNVNRWLRKITHMLNTDLEEAF
jgi:hypothetical protein